MIDSELNSVRDLATRHRLSIERVDVILKLKGMEEKGIFISTLTHFRTYERPR